MSSTIGERVRISIFGQSHGEAIGVVIDGLPEGMAIDGQALAALMARRAPGGKSTATPRKELDAVRFVSGLVNGKTCGAPLCAIIENTDTRSADYSALADLPRPGHADFSACLKYGPHHDVRGGGHFSGRLTAPLCVAGGIALQYLAGRGIWIGAHALSIGTVRDTPFDAVNATKEQILAPGASPFPTLDSAAAADMEKLILAARDEGDSVGGVIECCVLNMPGGYGEPMFDGIENRLSRMVFGIPGVRGISFGAGFDAAAMPGSMHNDPYCVRGDAIRTLTNHHGGILGGISTGMPILFQVAVKPTPSIRKPQQTVRLSTKQEERLVMEGRHDPCIVPRAVPCVEAAAALVMLDMLVG